MQSKTVDYILISFFILIACYAGNEVFRKSFHFPFDGGERISVGKLISLENDVRKKSFDQLSWYPANGSDSVFNNDFIFTDKDSRAKLEFISGNEIQINEESLFKVIQNGDDINIDIKKGFLWASLKNSAQALVIAIENKLVQIKSSNGRVKIDNRSNGEKTISVLSGEITIVHGKKSQTIKKGEQAVVTASNIKSQKQWPETFGFIDGQDLYVSKEKAHQFKLNEIDKIEKVIVSTDSKFEKFKEVTLKKNIFKYKFLKEGTHYLKYKSQGRETVASLNTIFERDLNLKAQRNFVFNGEDLKLSWDKFGSNYLVNIKEIESSKERRFEHSLTELVVSDLSLGQKEISVKVSDKDRNNAKWSKAINIRVLPKPTSGPIKIGPKKNHEIYSYGPHKQIFSWSDEAKVGNYIFSISGREYELKDINKLHEFVDSGTYSWNVAYKFSDQKIWGEERKIHLYIDNDSSPLEKGRKLILKRPGDEVDFNWDGELGQKEFFLVEISKDGNFSNPIERIKTAKNNAKRSFKDLGTYFWRTKIITPEGKIKYAKPVKIILTPPPPPAPPKLRDLKRKVFFKNLYNKLNIWLNIFFQSAHASKKNIILDWDGVENVQKYKVQVYKEDEKIFETITIKNNVEVKELEVGSYKWRVASIDFWGQVGEFSEFSKLTVEKEKKKQRESIKLISPYHKRVFKTKRAIKFRWKEVKNSKEYKLEFSKDRSFKKVGTFKSKNNYALVRPWKMGNDLYWRVRAGEEISKKRRILYKKSRLKKKPFKEKKVLEFFWTPGSTSREVTIAQSSIKVEGEDFVSFGLDYELMKESYVLKSNFFKSSGKVFSDQDYVENELTLSLGKRFRFAKVFGGAGLHNGSRYRISNSKVEEFRESAFYLNLESSFEFTLLRIQASLKVLGVTQIKIIADRNFVIFKRPVQLGVGYKSLEFDETKQSSVFLKIGSFISF